MNQEFHFHQYILPLPGTNVAAANAGLRYTLLIGSSITALFTILLFLGILWSLIHLSAFPDNITIRPGQASRKKQARIQKQDLIAIQASPEPAKHYFRQAEMGQVHYGRTEWRAFVLSLNLKGLMLQTKQCNYFFTCPRAEEAAGLLRETYSLPDLPVTPPPSLHD